jgi:hypothetical protein
MKNLAQERKQWLGAVDVEKRAHASQHGRNGRLVESLQRKLTLRFQSFDDMRSEQASVRRAEEGLAKPQSRI